MNKDTFLEELREKTAEKNLSLPGDHWWECPSNGALRSRCQHCPITFVANHRDSKFGVNEWRKAARALGIEEDLATEIVCAADGCAFFEREYSKTLREELFAACDPFIYESEEGRDG